MKIVRLFLLLVLAGTAHAESFDRRNAFDSQIKDPARITQIISRLDREENEIETQRKDLAKRLTILDQAIATLRKLELDRVPPASIPDSIRELMKSEAKLADPAAVKPHIADFEALGAAIKPVLAALRPIDDAMAQLTATATQLTANRWPEINRVRQARLRGPSCDLEDFNDYISRVRAFNAPPAQTNASAPQQAAPAANAIPAAVTAPAAPAAPAAPQRPVRLPTGDVQSCVAFAQNLPQPDAIRNSVVADIEAIATATRRSLDEVTKNQDEIVSNKSKWERQLRRAIDISSQLIDWTIPAIGLLVIGLMAIPIFYRTETQASIIESGFILEVFTVFLLISATLVLGIAERIPQEALGTLLGGISGFVLGRSLNQKKNETSGANHGGGSSRRNEPPPSDKPLQQPIPA